MACQVALGLGKATIGSGTYHLPLEFPVSIYHHVSIRQCRLPCNWAYQAMRPSSPSTYGYMDITAGFETLVELCHARPDLGRIQDTRYRGTIVDYSISEYNYPEPGTMSNSNDRGVPLPLLRPAIATIIPSISRQSSYTSWVTPWVSAACTLRAAGAGMTTIKS